MRAIETPLLGPVIIEPVPLSDERGFFARTWCARTFAEWGLDPGIVQCSVSFNERRGTLRGMHYQADPHGEAKVVRCTRGAIFDAIVDIRPESRSFGQWFGIELTADNRKALFIPSGFAHGFQSLTDKAEVFYLISTDYVPAAARGIHHADPSVGISWPLPIAVISDRDRLLPVLRP